MQTLMSQVTKRRGINGPRLLRLHFRRAPPSVRSETWTWSHAREYVTPGRSESQRLSDPDEYVTPSVRLPCRTTRRSLVLHRMTSTTSAPFSSHYETMGNMELFPPCTRSMTRRSAACRTIRSTGGKRSGLVRSLRHQHASWARSHQTDPKWMPSRCSFRS